MTTFVPGIDISSNQPFTPPLGGQAFVIVKATEGTWHDPLYATHTANARAAGAVAMAYHMNRSDVDVRSQAAEFLKVAADADFLWLDVEKVSGKPPFTIAQATLFVSTIHAAGRLIGLYHSVAGFFDAGQDANWVSSWGLNDGVPHAQPAIPWTLWQFTSFYPITSAMRVDADFFHGTTAGLRAWIHGLPDTSTGDAVVITRDLFDAQRGVTGTNVTLWLPDGTSQVVAQLDSAAIATAVIDSDHAPKGGGWLQLSAKPYAGWYVATASVTLAPPAPDPTPFGQADLDAASNDAAKAAAASVKASAEAAAAKYGA